MRFIFLHVLVSSQDVSFVKKNLVCATIVVSKLFNSKWTAFIHFLYAHYHNLVI